MVFLWLPCCLPFSAAGGVHASEHVRELHSAADLSDFISSQEERVLTVVDVSISNADPCIHIYPAVLALARSFKGYAAFGRWGLEGSAVNWCSAC